MLRTSLAMSGIRTLLRFDVLEYAADHSWRIRVAMTSFAREWMFLFSREQPLVYSIEAFDERNRANDEYAKGGRMGSCRGRLCSIVRAHLAVVNS